MNSASALPRPAPSFDNRTIQNVYITIHIVYYTFHTVYYTLCICIFCIVICPYDCFPFWAVNMVHCVCTNCIYTKRIGAIQSVQSSVLSTRCTKRIWCVLRLCYTLCIYKNCIVRNVAIHIVYIQFVYLAIVLVRYYSYARILLLYKTYIIGIFCIFNHFRKICFFIEKVLQK